MGINKQLKIAYSGSLDAYEVKKSKGFLSKIQAYFWTYKHQTVDSSTRSAYFLIQAIHLLKKRHSNFNSEMLKVQLWGHINKINQKQVDELGLQEFFEISSYLKKHESLKRLSEADVLFLPLEKSSVEGRKTLFIPGKLFEYLNANKPIFALAEPSDCKDILIKSGMSIDVKPDDIEAIADALWQMINDETFLKGLKPNLDFIREFSFENKTKELVKIFDKVIVERN